MAGKKKYLIYFEQINQCRYEILAENQEQAVKKAKKLWRSEHKYPYPSGIEELTIEFSEVNA